MVRRELGHLRIARLDFADVADIAAAIMGGVGIEHLPPLAGEGHADAIVAIDVRREIDDDQAPRARVDCPCAARRTRCGWRRR